jgi:hypothetical protein
MSREVSADMVARMPPYLDCCSSHGVVFNESTPLDRECCLYANDTNACITCISKIESDRISSYEYDRYRGNRNSISILLTAVIITFALFVISLLILIANTITSLVRATKTGFLNHGLKLATIIIFTICTVLLGAMILFYFLR